MKKSPAPKTKDRAAICSGRGDLVPFFRSKVNVFAGLPDSDLRELAAACEPEAYDSGDIFCHSGEATDAIRIVKEGLVQLNRCSRNGGNIAIEVLVPGDALGFAALMDSAWPVNAMAMKPSCLLTIPKKKMLAIMERRPAVSKMVIAHFIQRLRFLGTQLFLSREPVEKRLIAALLYLWQKFGKDIPLTCADIGALAGTTPETTIRIFSLLRSAELISTSRGMVRLRSVARLKERLGLE